MPNAQAPSSPSAEDPSDRPILRMTGVSKRFPGVRALEDVHLEVGPARDSCAARRERRGQVDAAEDPLWRSQRGRGNDRTFRSARYVCDAARCAARRDRHDLPGIHARPRHDDRRERVHRPRAGLEALRQLAPARRGDAGDHRQDRPEARSDDAGARSLGGRAAARRDRAGALHALAAHRHGRADLGAERNRGRQSCPHHPHAEGRGPVDHLRHPSAGGGLPALRPLYRAARRPLRRLGSRRRHRTSTPSSA